MKIIFEFMGGPMDGTTVSGALGDQDEADRYYALTHHGKIGHQFKVASELAVDTLSEERLQQETPHHFQRHKYQVADRLEENDEVLVRAEYLMEEIEASDTRRATF